MKFSYTFNIKDLNTQKETLIYLRAYVKDEEKYLKYSTGEKIKPSNWDNVNKFPRKLKGKSTEAIQINSTINQLSRYAEAFQLACTKLEAMYIPLTVASIKEELNYNFKKNAVAPRSFIKLFDQCIQEKKDLGSVTPQTIKLYENIKFILTEFSKQERYALNFKSINETFYIKFVKYSRKILKHKDNTLGRNIGFIKTFMNWALLKKYHTNIDFKNFKKPSSETDEIALSLNDIETLVNFNFSEKPRLAKVRDVFIFGCTTGMRYSDYSKINKSNIRDGHIFINSQKQKNNIGIPLNKYSKTVLEKYDYNLPIISAQKFREYIKEACKEAGFTETMTKTTFRGHERIEEKFLRYERISSHTARRTFITLSLEKGMNQEVIMSITGHKSYNSFKKYIRLSNKMRQEQMSKAWD